MGIQGMKSWKLGAFFVISLMLIAGLFTNTASAQTASVTVRPDMVTAQEVIDSVTVIYAVTGVAVASENTISVMLPFGWAAAYPSDDATFGSLNSGNTIDFTGTSADSMESSLEATANPQTTSYVTVRYLTGAVSTVTASTRISSSMSNAVVEVIPNTMAVDDTVIVTFHNVMVRALTGDDLLGGVRNPKRAPDMLTITDTVADDTVFEASIQVDHRAMSNVSVKPSSVKTEATANVVVGYAARETVIGSNIVTIGLPPGWGRRLSC